MERALVNRTGRPDALGQIVLDYPHLVHDGEIRWLCLEEGQPEPEVLVARDAFGRQVGILTGRFRPCPIPS